MDGLDVSDLFLVINNWPKIDEARISVVTDGKCVGVFVWFAGWSRHDHD